MPRDRRDVEAALKNKGFRLKDGDHHFFLYYTLGGLKSRVFTKTSHNEKQIRDDILSLMAKQCRLTNKLFGTLVDCPLTQEAYEAGLRSQGIIQ
jgi:hypothetical protein